MAGTTASTRMVVNLFCLGRKHQRGYQQDIMASVIARTQLFTLIWCYRVSLDQWRDVVLVDEEVNIDIKRRKSHSSEEAHRRLMFVERFTKTLNLVMMNRPTPTM